MTHNDLVERAGKWLKSFGCSVVLCERVAYTRYREIPDAIGWKGSQSILIECKVSRADFLRDKKKIFRMYPEYGMGERRLYMCPPGIINKEDLPVGWGLLWVKGKRAKRIVAPKGNCFWHNGPCHQFHKRSHVSEIAMLVSTIRRMESTTLHEHEETT